MMLMIANEDALDPFGKDIMKFKTGDLLKKWNGEELTLSNIEGVMVGYAMSAGEGTELKVTVLRKDGNGIYQEVELSGTVQKVPMKVKHAFSIDPNPTPQQLKIRKA